MGSAGNKRPRKEKQRFTFTASASLPVLPAHDSLLTKNQFAHLQNGRYFAITLPPGEHTLADKNPKDYIRFSVEANKVYYVHAEWAENGGLKFNARFSIPDPETGAADVRRLKPSDDSQIENHKIAFLTHRPK